MWREWRGQGPRPGRHSATEGEGLGGKEGGREEVDSDFEDCVREFCRARTVVELSRTV